MCKCSEYRNLRAFRDIRQVAEYEWAVDIQCVHCGRTETVEKTDSVMTALRRAGCNGQSFDIGNPTGANDDHDLS